jgi:hypothetical protein
MSQQQSNVGKIIGFTCLGIIGIPILITTITTLAFTGNLGFIVPLLVVGGIIALVVSSSKRQKKKISAWEASQPPIAMRTAPQQSATPMPAVAPTSSARVIGFETSVCQHVFTEADLKDKESVTCLCGYSYSVENLRDYAQLTKRFNETQQKLVMLERALLEGTRVRSSQAPAASAPAQAARVPVLTKPAIAPQTAKPVVAPVVKRKRVALSAQQWLVMGASALSVMAGSVFVSANINNLDSFAFLLITLGVGSVTGFLAFWGRKFSVMLVNFMATFSSAMQMFSILIIGDMLFEFAWDSAPAWWWSIDLLVVSAIAFVLARFKANFAWKLLSIASLLASASALVLGPLSDLYSLWSGSFGWIAATCTVAGVGLALVSKMVANYKYVVPKDSQDVEYEKDLAVREAAVVRTVARIATALLLGGGLGYVLLGLLTTLISGIEPLSFTAFALVWVAAGAFQEKWISVLGASESGQKTLNFWQHIVGFVSLALALNSWVLFLSAGNLWIGVAGTSALFFTGAVLVAKVKRVAAHPIAMMIAQYALLATWFFWYSPVQLTRDVGLPLVGSVLILFALSQMLEHALSFSRRALTGGLVTNTLGLLLLALNVRIDAAGNVSSVGFVVTALGLIVLSASYSPMHELINAKHKKQFTDTFNKLVLGATGVITVVLVMPIGLISDISTYVPLTSVLFIAATVTGLASVIFRKLPDDIRSLLRSYFYLFQAVLGVLLVLSTENVANATTIAIHLAALALMNYTLAWLGKRHFEGWLGYGLALVSLLMALSAQLPYWQLWSHLALAMGASLVIAIAHNLVTKRAGLGSMPYVSYVVCLAFALASYLMNFEAWRNGFNPEQIWIGLAEVLAIAIGGALVAERKGIKSDSALRINSLAYLVFGFLGFANVDFVSLMMIGEERTTSPLIRQMLVALVFAAITFRQLSKVSKTEHKSLISGWFALSYLGPVALGVYLPMYFQYWLPAGTWLDELSPLPFVLVLAIPTFFNKSIAKGKRSLTALDVPVLVLVLIELSKALAAGINTYEGLDRLAIVLTLAAVFAYWRSVAEKQIAWVYGGYVLGGLGALVIGNELQRRLLPDLVVPELYTVLLSLSLYVGAIFLSKRTELKAVTKSLLRVDIPVLIPVVVSIAYSTTQDLSDLLNVSRLLLSALVFTGYARWKLASSKIMTWSALSYLGTIGSALVLVRLVYIFAPGIWTGPEIMSLALTGAVFVGNQGVSKVREFKTSLIRYGLPFATLIVPSIFYSYAALSDSFDVMGIDQLIRILTLVVVSLVSFVLAMRAGNLGISIVGGSSLALIVLPLSWVRAGDSVNSESIVSLRSIVIAAFLWALLALLTRVKALPRTSYIYLGIPMAVALVPTLFISIQALGNPELTSVDWWRFGITVTVSLVLLIVGSLRNLGGLFFPGLVGVFLGVLPYAFKPIASRSWFLWMILLFIAAIMIWIAVRLEQMRKVGKSSISWVKALK